MGVKIDATRAEARLREALRIARSDAALPDEWLLRTRRVGAATSRSFTPMLGTALLAKATDDQVSALALKAGAGHNAYSARGVCHNVLVPVCVEEGVHLRTTGREPLNNQPFFRYEIVSRDMKTRATRAELDYLVECLEQTDFLRGQDALLALAAFLRARLADPASQALTFRGVASDGRTWPFDEVARFVFEDPEEGRRAQALVAAAFDLVYEDVRTSRVHDPSRTWPGDVHVGSPKPSLAAEVRQKEVTGSDVVQFVDRCAQAEIQRGAVMAFARDQAPLAAEEMVRTAWDQGVLFELWDDPVLFLRHAAITAPVGLDLSWPMFAERMLRRLEEMEVRRTTVQDWTAIVEQQGQDE